jgi:hypothetical protein
MAMSLNKKPNLNNSSDEKQVQGTWTAVEITEFIYCKDVEIH